MIPKELKGSKKKQRRRAFLEREIKRANLKTFSEQMTERMQKMGLMRLSKDRE